MSDETDCTITNHSVDECDSVSCYIPRKKIKLTPIKNRNARSLTDKISLNHIPSNSWKLIDKNETMIAELSGGKLTLWQFLLELLMTDGYSNLIKWTDRNIGEFILIQAEEVAKLWGIRKDRNHRMNYDKLSRALRYYYQKNIIKKVHGHKFVYRFVSLIPESSAGSGACLKAISSGNDNLSPQNQPSISVSDTESASNDNCNQKTPINRLLSSIPPIARSINKYNKKAEFNSTLTALFQAALLSLSGSNPEMPSTMFLNNKDSEPCVDSPQSPQNSENSLNRIHAFDILKQNPTLLRQECVCKPEVVPNTAGMFFPSSSGSTSSMHIPPFDRQSMLHFSRHSINMQRLSQEIILHATSKSRFNSCISNPLISSTIDPINNSVEQINHNFWLNQFASDLYKSSITKQNSQDKTESSTKITHASTIEKDSTELKIKSEKFVDSTPVTESEDFNSLAALFQRFLKEFENKTSSPSKSINGDCYQQYNNYSHTNLANLIKSQLSSNSAFVWMPVPVTFAEEIMEFCVRSLDNHSP